MTFRSGFGLGGALLFPANLGFLWCSGVKAGFIDFLSIVWFLPALIVLGIPAGFVLGWLVTAMFQGIVEEQVTRIDERVERGDPNELS